jgi:hypothetical protein
MQEWEAWNAWKLRIFLLLGLALIVFDNVSEGQLSLGVPRGLALYLIASSLYFAINPQKRVEKAVRRALVYSFFPGAFVTTLVPLYTVLLSIARYFQI